jgi:hypothetical protein
MLQDLGARVSAGVEGRVSICVTGFRIGVTTRQKNPIAIIEPPSLCIM